VHAHGFTCDRCGAPAYATLFYPAWAGHYCVLCADELVAAKQPQLILVATEET
jgi:hypothetical protein